jgi:hypothetical protein
MIVFSQNTPADGRLYAGATLAILFAAMLASLGIGASRATAR